MDEQATRISNRIRGLLTGIHPALERAMESGKATGQRVNGVGCPERSRRSALSSG